MVNINTKTGIAYGYIAANALDSEIVDELLHGSQAKDLSYEEALKEAFPEGDDTGCTEQDFADGYECEEPNIVGTYHGVSYGTSYLGGALNFWIFESPITTDKARLASPCVPNAGILDTLDGSVTSYDVPADWRFVNTFAV